jgi:hypothetical protein
VGGREEWREGGRNGRGGRKGRKGRGREEESGGLCVCVCVQGDKLAVLMSTINPPATVLKCEWGKVRAPDTITCTAPHEHLSL